MPDAYDRWTTCLLFVCRDSICVSLVVCGPMEFSFLKCSLLNLCSLDTVPPLSVTVCQLGDVAVAFC